MFFKYCSDPVSKLSETASLSLANILEKFDVEGEEKDGKLESIVKLVKKNFLYT